MQNTESFFNPTFFPMDKPLLITAPFDGRSEQYSGNDYDVLIFSREKDTRLLLKTLLKLWKYRAEDSDSPNEFWELVESHRPKVILVDDFLPFEENLQFIAQIRRNELSRKTPVILLSGFPESKFRKMTLDAGADDFFEKPLDLNLLENYLMSRIPRAIDEIEERRR